MNWVETHKTAAITSAVLLSLALAGVLALLSSVNGPYTVTYNRADMAPTILPNQEITIKQVDFSKIKRGDLIYFETETMGTSVKRVVGVPGDVVSVEQGDLHVHLDDFNLYQPYVGQRVSDVDGQYDVGLYQLFVSGDNLQPGASIDSKNSLGLVSADTILGLVEL